MYAVFDGHGGDWCAKFITQRFEEEIKKNMLDPEKGLFGTKQVPFNECIHNVLDKSFKNLDERYYNERNHLANKCGSTACVVFIIGAHIFCANIGDSRAVLSKNGKAINLSMDHKASRDDEVERIKKSDGQVELGRVGGKIAITRAFGDFEFKIIIDDEGQLVRKDIIIAEPEIRAYNYDPNQDEFIIIASDGLFDIFSSQEAVDFVKEKMKGYGHLKQDFDVISKQIAFEAIFKKGVRDNTTVIIINLNRGTKFSLDFFDNKNRRPS